MGAEVDLNDAELDELDDSSELAWLAAAGGTHVAASGRHWGMMRRLLAEVRRRRKEDAREVYTTGVLARLLGYHEDQVRQMCEVGRFEGAYRAGQGAHWRIPKEAVRVFKDACRPKIRRRA